MTDNALDAAPPTTPRPVALITGGSRGLGRSLAVRLVAGGWHVVVDGRDAAVLASAARDLRPSSPTAGHVTATAGHVTPTAGDVTAIAGDVADPAHRDRLAQEVGRLGRLDLLVNNASTLGPTPLPPLAELPLPALRQVVEVNTVAPLALIQLMLPLLRRSAGRILDVSSDAAVEAYPGWGAYGCAKAALDRLGAVLAVEEPALRVYSVDPGDMATDLHRQAAPDEDLSGLPSPDAVAPVVLRLATGDLPSGRYTAGQLQTGQFQTGQLHPGLPAASGAPA
jgi:NAD(P)-dependent dehydrogenase (short-subunit alcohol dehydrogenase family)